MAEGRKGNGEDEGLKDDDEWDEEWQEEDEEWQEEERRRGMARGGEEEEW
jgi:hypothetical protein